MSVPKGVSCLAKSIRCRCIVRRLVAATGPLALMSWQMWESARWVTWCGPLMSKIVREFGRFAMSFTMMQWAGAAEAKRCTDTLMVRNWFEPNVAGGGGADGRGRTAGGRAAGAGVEGLCREQQATLQRKWKGRSVVDSE